VLDVKKKILSGILGFGILCSGLLINLGIPTPASATVSLPQCLTDQTGLSEFNAVTNNVELVARLIYSEAAAESMDGKKGVAQVVINRQLKNLSEFGGTNVRNVVLKTPGGFDGMTKSGARCPSDVLAWNNSWLAANDPGSATKRVGSTLWFNTPTVFAQRDGYDGAGYLTYTFPGQPAKRVMERVDIGNHIFFRVYGY